MTLPKLLAFSAIILFGLIGFLAFFKKNGNSHENVVSTISAKVPIEIEIEHHEKELVVLPTSSEKLTTPSNNVTPQQLQEPSPKKTLVTLEKNEATENQETPDADRVAEFFNLSDPQFPIVETITYKSKVSWQKGRPAWLSDYASHYKTSRHFIARSLNGKPDYLKQDLAEGARFTILKPEKNVQFNLIIDTNRCKMWFYYHDLDTKEKVLVKTYPIGLGRIDHSKISGLLTPLGVFSLGSRIAVYQPKVTGLHNGSKIEMIRVFGTRWIPFEKEIAGTTAPAKGFGIHGLPWITKNNVLVEDRSSLGKYESDGCIRMAVEDIEELYAIVITRPTTVEIVKDFFDAENAIITIK